MSQTLSRSDHGRTIPAAVGDVLTLSLPENPTTGYRWELEEGDGAGVVVEGSEFRPSGAAAAGAAVPAVGAGGERVVRLRVARPGEAAVRLALRRPWGDREPADRFEFVARASG